MSSPSRRRLPSRRFLIASLALCALVPLVAWLRRPAPRVPAKPYRFPSAELAILDNAVQARFAIVPDKDFGLPRIGPRHGYFSPETSSEKAAVQGLQSARQEVVFYVVGRNVILKQQNWLGNPPVQGPVYITPRTVPGVAPARLFGKDDRSQRYYFLYQTRFLSSKGAAKDAPTDPELTKLARQVFGNDTLRNGTDKTLGKWRVVARPIAASSPSCVDCHNSRAAWKPSEQQPRFGTWNAKHDVVALGDTLGIALYCYRQAGKIEPKPLGKEFDVFQPKTP